MRDLRRILACVLVLGTMLGVDPGAAQDTELKEIAEAAMQARARVLRGMPDVEALQGNARAEQIRAAMARPFQAAQTERRGYTAAGLTIPRAESEVRVKNTRAEGDRATLTADVQSTIFLAGVAGAPDRTVEVVEHEFEYARRNGRWELVEDRVPDPFRQAVRDTYPESPKVTGAGSSRDRNGPRRAPVRTRGGGVGMLRDGGSGFTRFATDAPARYFLDPAAVVTYARRYAITYNTGYRDFNNSGTRGGDCTNFVSQSMRAGGWADVGGYTNRTTAAAWWYDYFTQTYTWVNAHYFYQYIGANRASLAVNVYDLEPGDVLQMDFEANGDIDHTTVVTKKDANGMVYLSYHTSNTLDKPFSTFQSQVAAGTSYYGWLLYY